MYQPVQEVMHCRSTSPAGDYDYDSDTTEEDTHGRNRLLILILAPIGGFIGFLILVGIICAVRRQQKAQHRTLSVCAAQTRGTLRVLS